MVTVEAVEGHIDLSDREPFSSLLRVGGWALLPEASVTRVEILVDGIEVGSARLGIPRPDLATAFPATQAPVAGFMKLLDLAELPGPGEVTVSALVHGTDGSNARLADRIVVLGGLEDHFKDAGGRAGQLRVRASRAVRSASPSPGAPRMLVFTHDLELGGAQLYLVEILRRLMDRSDWSCTVVSPKDGPLRDRLEEIGVPVHVTSGYGLEDVEGYEGKMAELCAWAATQNFNVVLANTVIGFVGVDAGSRIGVPGIFMVHESMEVARWSASTHRWLSPHRYVRERMEEAFGAASASVFEADATRAQYAHLGDPRRFLAMPYAVELEGIVGYRERYDSQAARRRLGVPDEAKVVLCLGTFEPRKAQTCLVQAFAMIASRHPDALLCLVGDRGDAFSNSIRDYTSRAGLWPRTLIRPMVEDPYEWLGMAECLVMASDRESLPRVVLEAMAFGTPVVSTRIFGLAELLDDGRTGIVCEPRDTAALAEGLDRMLSLSSDERRAMVRAAQETVWSDHHPEGYAEDFAQLVQAVIEDPAVLSRDGALPDPAFAPADR